MTKRRLKTAIELVSDIGSVGFDLQHHSERDIAAAVAVLREVNGPMFDWLLRVLDGRPRYSAHGVTCPKVEHTGTGHLHGAEDDWPYDVDGVRYCGRCHVAI